MGESNGAFRHVNSLVYGREKKVVPLPLAKTCVFLLLLSKKSFENRRKPLSIKDTIFLFFQKTPVFTCTICAMWRKLVLNF